jgi:hypothetical protein
MIIYNNKFDTLIEKKSRNPLIPFLVENIENKYIKVGIIPGVVFFRANGLALSPLKKTTYYECQDGDAIYLNLKVTTLKSPVIGKINIANPDVYINCFLENEKNTLFRELDKILEEAGEEEKEEVEERKKEYQKNFDEAVEEEKKRSIRYYKHNKFIIKDVEASIIKTKKIENENLSKTEGDVTIVNFILAEVEKQEVSVKEGEDDKVLKKDLTNLSLLTPTNRSGPQLLINYFIINEGTQTYSDIKILNSEYPDVKQFTSIDFFLEFI